MNTRYYKRKQKPYRFGVMRLFLGLFIGILLLFLGSVLLVDVVIDIVETPQNDTCIISAEAVPTQAITQDSQKLDAREIPVTVIPLIPEKEPELVLEKPQVSPGGFHCENKDDYWMLACVIYKEAGADYIRNSTRIMVGNVVLNRVRHKDFPDSIEKVLLEEGAYNTFYWTGVVWPERASYQEELHAVDRAYECAARVLEGEKLLPDDVIFQAEFPQGSEVVVFQDGIYFCR